MAAACALLPVRPAAADSLEYPVKAAFLYKFGPFVEWPASAFDSPTSPVAICVSGDDPFGPVLEQTVAGQQVGQRAIVVRRIEVAQRGVPCHILYVSGSKKQSVAEGLKAVQGAPILTVTDQARGGTRGAVHFVLAGQRVRFHIDEQAAVRNGVTISSKLLSLALTVRSRKAAG